MNVLIFSRSFWARHSRTIHLTFGWFGGIALLIWGISGIAHPIMSWTGPEQAKFFPPKLSADLSQLKSPVQILKSAGIDQAYLVRVAQSFDGAVLQVTDKKDAPRRYFSLKSGEELANRDQEQAVWLARYYTGLKDEPVAKITLQNTFDDDYPRVNRLLPIWRVEFASPDQRRAYIYTEINALATQHNSNRYALQAVFQALHTWRWLENFENAQIVLMGGLMIALIGMSLTGIAMILSFKRRPIADKSKRWHRRIAYIVWLPIFAFSASGFFHLLQKRIGENIRGMGEMQTMDLRPMLDTPAQIWKEAAGSGAANALSVVQGADALLIRVERPATDAMPSAAALEGGGEHAHHMPVTREQRFAGKSNHGGIIYYNAITGAALHNYDQTMAHFLAVKLGGARAENITGVEAVTRFGDGYDFRNKRLPVWQVNLNDDKSRSLYIDSGANMLIDQSSQMQRIESYSFTYLHKWSFLRPLGRGVQDGLIVGSIVLAMMATIFGFFMLWRQRQKRTTSIKKQAYAIPAE